MDLEVTKPTFVPFFIICCIVSVMAYSPDSDCGVCSISSKISCVNLYIPAFTVWLTTSFGFSSISLTVPFSEITTPYPVVCFLSTASRVVAPFFRARRSDTVLASTMLSPLVTRKSPSTRSFTCFTACAVPSWAFWKT